MKLAVLTSGGDAPGMNAAVRAVVRAGGAAGHDVIGFYEGYRGLVGGEMTDLDSAAVSEIIDRGGTILRTSRFNEFLEPDVRAKAVRQLRRHGVDCLLVIGGEGSMRGADCLCALGMPVITLPASIDNDICGTDISIGYDTALNTVIEVLGKLRDTASAHERIFVVEVMGRRSGAIALGAGVAGGADYICVPGSPATDPAQIARICAVVNRRQQTGKTHTLILVAEGAGSAESVAAAVGAGTHLEVRVSVPGHIQRGGSPSAVDRLLASKLGAYAVELAAAGSSGLMAGLVGGETTATPLAQTFATEKPPDKELAALAALLV